MKKFALLLVLMAVAFGLSGFSGFDNRRMVTIIGPQTLDSTFITSSAVNIEGAKYVILEFFNRNDSAGARADSVQLDSIGVSMNDSTYYFELMGSGATPSRALTVSNSIRTQTLRLGPPAGGAAYAGPRISVIAPQDVLGTGLGFPTDERLVWKYLKLKMKGYASYKTLANTAVTGNYRRMDAFTVRAHIVYNP